MVCIILHSVNLFLCAESQSEAVDTMKKVIPKVILYIQ